MSDKNKMEVLSVRVDPDDLKLAKFYKVDMADIFRKSLSFEIAKRKGACPLCHNKLKWEKLE